MVNIANAGIPACRTVASHREAGIPACLTEMVNVMKCVVFLDYINNNRTLPTEPRFP